MAEKKLRGKSSEKIDLVMAEVVRRRLDSIVEEMATEMRHQSGSPIMTEANDFSVALLSRKVEILSYAMYVSLHIGPSVICIQNFLRERDISTIRPGDKFVVNNPYLGSAHCNDTGVITPIFYQGGIVAWAWSETHLADVGGMGIGGWSPEATDYYQEGLHLDFVRIADKDGIVEETEQLIKGNVRAPDMVIGDIKALIGAGTVCEKRLADLLDEIGLETFEKINEYNLKLDEELVRRRIRGIPDGDYEAETWLEHDGVRENFDRLHLKVTVRDDELIFDYSESCPQEPGPNNAPLGAVFGFTMSGLLSILAWDMIVSSGIVRPIRCVTRKGTITEPIPPAAVSCGHMECGLKIERLIPRAMAKALIKAEDPELRSRAFASFNENAAFQMFMGQDLRRGEPFFFVNMDIVMGGGGAQTVCDGLHTAGVVTTSDVNLPDVEWHELLYPMLYLYRRLCPNSGGPGYYRGGIGGETAYIPWNSSEWHGTMFGQNYAYPGGEGVYGGYPGSGNFHDIIRGIDMEQHFARGVVIGNQEELGDLIKKEGAEIVPVYMKVTRLHLSPKDIFRFNHAGGAGLGDPLLRDPDLVEWDVRRGLVSIDVARKAYGTIIDPETKEVNLGQTEKERERMREERLKKAGIK